MQVEYTRGNSILNSEAQIAGQVKESDYQSSDNANSNCARGSATTPCFHSMYLPLRELRIDGITRFCFIRMARYDAHSAAPRHILAGQRHDPLHGK